MRHITQLTLRGIEPRVQREIRELARRERLSLNKAALRLLEKGAGLERDQTQETECVGHSLDHLIGTWTEHEAEALLASVHSCEQVDEELWR